MNLALLVNNDVTPADLRLETRDLGGIFSGDSYLSPRHATFILRAGRLFVKDELSLNGVYIKLMPEQPHELRSGEVFFVPGPDHRFHGGR